jgi:hypothetical protein
MVAALGDDLPDAIFLPKASGFLMNATSIPASAATRSVCAWIASRNGRRVIEQLDSAAIERDRHRLCVTHARQRSLDKHPVEARQHSLDTVSVTFDQVRHLATISPLVHSRFLLGSGCAGVGKSRQSDSP